MYPPIFIEIFLIPNHFQFNISKANIPNIKEIIYFLLYLPSQSKPNRKRPP